jgi:predicted dehydrogenase
MMRVGLSGCGAVTQLYYGPALRLLANEGCLQLTAVFDPDRASAAAIAGPNSATTCARFEDLLGLGLDLLLVASPPPVHAPQAIAALKAGIAVHCEKPLALSAHDGARMLEAASLARRPLSVALMRRSFPAVRAIGALLAAQAIGPLRSVEVFEGGPFRWPVGSPAYFSQAQSGGGVFRDMGPHALDLLSGWLGAPELNSYRDDAMGGVETNCRLELAYGGVPCVIRMSRDWARPNRYLFKGAHGWLSWIPYEPDRLEIDVGDGVCGVLALHKRIPGDTPALGEPEGDFAAAFAGHLRDVVAGLRAPTFATRRSLGLETLEFIDRCYVERSPIEELWRDSPAIWTCAS